jgi:hypothetical protein
MCFCEHDNVQIMFCTHPGRRRAYYTETDSGQSHRTMNEILQTVKSRIVRTLPSAKWLLYEPLF